MYGSEAPEADSGGPGGGSGGPGAGSDVGPQGPSATWGLATAGLTRPKQRSIVAPQEAASGGGSGVPAVGVIFPASNKETTPLEELQERSRTIRSITRMIRSSSRSTFMRVLRVFKGV